MARPAPLAALLLLVAIAIRMRDFGNPTIHVDEQFYLLVGDRMLHGALPYVDIWDRKPVGLFLIFAAIRLLPGDGILAYQLVATLFAAATAWVIARTAVRLGAAPVGAIVAGVAYILWLSLLSGRGGQSPVFYNLFVAGAGMLTLALGKLAERQDRHGIILSGAAACLLSGLAIQTKYTPVVEGAFFGLAHVWALRRAGARWPMIIAAAAVWIALGIAPTALVVADYARRGPAVFDAFWFSNFASVALRRGYPATKIVARLAGTTGQLSPFIACAVIGWRSMPQSAEKWLAFGWLAAALVAFAMIGAFFDHYALPLLAPLLVICAPVFGRSRIARTATLGIGIILFVTRVAIWPNDGASVRAAARAVAEASKVSGNEGDCPFVFAGDSIIYQLANACLPTAYVFPSTLAYEPERGASGIDEAKEVARIMARRPPAVVTLDTPLAPWNLASQSIVAAALQRDYRLVLAAPREGGHLLVYRKADAPRAKLTAESADTAR